MPWQAEKPPQAGLEGELIPTGQIGPADPACKEGVSGKEDPLLFINIPD
jgi:hypothetical protein